MVASSPGAGGMPVAKCWVIILYDILQEHHYAIAAGKSPACPPQDIVCLLHQQLASPMWHENSCLISQRYVLPVPNLHTRKFCIFSKSTKHKVESSTRLFRVSSFPGRQQRIESMGIIFTYCSDTMILIFARIRCLRVYPADWSYVADA